jgi:hypothetical protein
MPLQLSTAARNAMLDAIETATGTAARLELRTGAPPATCATADSGTLLISYTMASDWAASASSASKALNNLPLTGSATGTGNAGHWRLKDNAGTTCHAQGTVTATGGGGDMTVDNVSIASGQTVNVTGLTFTQGGA